MGTNSAAQAHSHLIPIAQQGCERPRVARHGLGPLLRLYRNCDFHCLLLAALVLLASSNRSVDADVGLRSVAVEVKFVDYKFAVQVDRNGVPKMDWGLFRSRPKRIRREKWSAIEIENNHIRVQLIPSMGRVHSFINKQTGNEQLWINPCAVPLGANNDTGFWMTWGGVERVLPRREHGTTHALEWKFAVESDRRDRKRVRCEVVEPITGIRQRQTFAVYQDRPYLETTIALTNEATTTQRFSYWSTMVLAPGGKGAVTPSTELIVPAASFRPDDRDFNQWMFTADMKTETSPLRFAKNWESIGDLMTSPLRRPYYALYSHESDEGILHVFDMTVTPTIDIWGWGYPPTESRQREFTAELPNMGYLEVWNGTAASFKDESLEEMAPNATLRWTEYTLPLDGILRNGGDLRKEVARRASNVQ